MKTLLQMYNRLHTCILFGKDLKSQYLSRFTRINSWCLDQYVIIKDQILIFNNYLEWPNDDSARLVMFLFETHLFKLVLQNFHSTYICNTSMTVLYLSNKKINKTSFLHKINGLFSNMCPVILLRR